METVANKRIDYFDIAKGLAMFCVIAGHMGVSQVNAFVFSFHMPLFFLISGYFFRNDGTKVWRNTKRLLIAYCWTVVAIIVLSEGMALAKVLVKGEDAIMLVKVPARWVVAGLYGSGARADFLGLNLPHIGAIWFLLALAWGGHLAYYQQNTRKMAAIYCLPIGLLGRVAFGKVDMAPLLPPGWHVRNAVHVHRI